MTTRTAIAVGFRKPSAPEKVYLSIAFDAETFERMRAMAVAANVSFAEQVRTIVEWGLDSAKP